MLVIHILIYFCNFIVLSSLENPYKDMKVDYAASTEAIKALVKHEMKIVKLFANYVESNADSPHADKMRSYITDFRLSTFGGMAWRNSAVTFGNKSVLDGDALGFEVSKHPIMSFRCIRRMVKLLTEITREISEDSLKEKLMALKTELPYPDWEDMATAMLALIRIKQIYQLSIDLLFDGEFEELKTGSGLNARICYEIGLFAQENHYHSHAIDFLDKALRMNPDNNFSFTSDELIDMEEKVTLAIAEHDARLRDGIPETDFHHDAMPYFFNMLVHGRFNASFQKRRPIRIDPQLDEASPIVLADRFEKLCRGEHLREPAQTSQLKCYLDSSKHLFWLIAPLKIEVHHEDPLVFQIYDVLTKSEMASLKHEVKSELRRSQTIAKSKEKPAATSRFRTSSNSWINDRIHPRFHYMNGKIGRVIGFDLVNDISTEQFQIANYAPGGHYWAHTDAVHEPMLLDTLDPAEFLKGDRLGTFMIYLSDVDAGGYTVFPLLKIFVKPVIGSAVFWFNLHTDGSIQRKMLHAGCPVMYGNKWVANKWMRHYDQMFTKKCPLSFNDEMNYTF